MDRTTYLAERFIVRAATAIALSGWGMVALAEAGALTRTSSLTVLALGLLGQRVLVRFTPGRAPDEAGHRTGAAVLLATAALAAVAALPPNDSTLWAGDATVALSSARQIARHGAIVYPDALLGSLPVEQREDLFRNRTPGDVTGTHARFPGGFAMSGPDDHRVSAGFSPLYPVLGAATMQWLGVGAMAWISPAFAVLAAVTMVLLGSRLAGAWPGAIAGMALAVSLPQAWLARAGTQAPLAQFLLLAGLLALVRADDDRQPTRRLIAAGIVLGVAIFATVDLLVTLTWALLLAAWVKAVGRRGGASLRPLFVAYALLLAHNIAHYAFWPSHYQTWFLQFARQRLGPSSLGAEAWAVGLALLAAAGGAIAAGWRLRPDLRSLAATALLLAAVLGGAGVYVLGSGALPGSEVDWLAWSIGWPALALGACGVVLVLLDAHRRRTEPAPPGPAAARSGALARVVLTATAVPYLYDAQANGDALLAMRRFLPAVLPVTLLLAAWASLRLARAVGRAGSGRWPAAVPWLAALGMVVAVGHRTSELWGRAWGLAPEFASIDSLARAIPGDALVLVSADLAGLHLATALSYLHDRHAVQLQEQSPAADGLLPLLEARLRASQPTLLLSGVQGLHVHAPAFRLQDELAATFVARALTASRRGTGWLREERAEAHLLLFQSSRDAVTLVDIGEMASDSLVEMRGFHAAERDPAAGADTTFRWTQGIATILVDGGRDVEVVLDGNRPPGAPPARVEISIDDHVAVADVELPPHATILRVAHPQAATKPRRLTLRSNTFSPVNLGASDDGRNLGVRVFAVRHVNPPPRR